MTEYAHHYPDGEKSRIPSPACGGHLIEGVLKDARLSAKDYSPEHSDDFISLNLLIQVIAHNDAVPLQQAAFALRKVLHDWAAAAPNHPLHFAETDGLRTWKIIIERSRDSWLDADDAIFCASKYDALDSRADRNLKRFGFNPSEILPILGLFKVGIGTPTQTQEPQETTAPEASKAIEAPPVVVPPDGSDEQDGNLGDRRRARQISAILAEISRREWDPLAVPRGGKTAVRTTCLEDAALFTEDAFKRAWQAAVNAGSVRMKDHEVYSGG